MKTSKKPGLFQIASTCPVKPTFVFIDSQLFPLESIWPCARVACSFHLCKKQTKKKQKKLKTKKKKLKKKKTEEEGNTQKLVHTDVKNKNK